MGDQRRASATLPTGEGLVGRRVSLVAFWRKENTFSSPGVEPRTVQLVASRYTDRAVPGPKSKLREYLRKTRESKVMHGQYIRSTK